MTSSIATPSGIDSVSDPSAEYSHPEGPLVTDSSDEEMEFHDCPEIDTLYLSFDAQDHQPSLTLEVPNAAPEEAKFSDVSEYRQHRRSESDAFYSCEGRTAESEDEGATCDSDTIENASPVELTPSMHLTEMPKESCEWRERCRKAFALRAIESMEAESSQGRDSGEEPPVLQSPRMTSLHPYSLAENFCKEERPSEQTPTSDMLVTLTTTDMGISAKREESVDPPRSSVRNVDSIPDSSIFDKAQLVEEALDTVDINKCMSVKVESRMSALPSLRRQEEYSDELRSITRKHRSRQSSSLVAHLCPSLPSYRMESIRRESGSALVRASSAPTDMKEGVMMAEDVEISSILGKGACFAAPEERPMSSLSEPFAEVIQTSPNGCKKCLTSWVRKKVHFVSFDTESDAASVTRSEYIMDLKRGKERLEDNEQRRCHHRSRPSSRSCYVNGFVVGPSVSPVPPGGLQDFSKEDAIALNAVLRNDPQLANIHMGEWTSKLIGFATPADYYVHMIHELSSQGINVLALIKTKLGEHHPLVTDIIEKLRNYTTEVPSFILSSFSKGHRRTLPLAPNQQLDLFSRGNDELLPQTVESALIHCGINLASFDKIRCSFSTEHEYHEYIACQIKTAGFVIPLQKLKEQLGEMHPFLEVFRQSSAVMECESDGRMGSLTDSARSIQSGTSKSSPRVTFCSEPPSVHSVSQVGSVFNECEDAAARGSCLFFCFSGLRRSLAGKRTNRRRNHSIAQV